MGTPIHSHFYLSAVDYPGGKAQVHIKAFQGMTRDLALLEVQDLNESTPGLIETLR